MTPEDFESLLDCIYAAAEDPRLWEGVLGELTSQLPGVGGALHAGRLDGTGFCFGTTYRIDPASLADYAEYYYSVNPLNVALARIPAGKAVPDHELVAPGNIERTEFYSDYARRHDIVGSVTLVLERDSQHEACLGIVRDHRSDIFSQEQVAFVQRLGPHLRRAINLNRKLAALEENPRGLEAALDYMETAVFLLTGTGAVCYANAAGLSLLESRDGLKVRHNRLFVDSSSAENSLASLIRAAIAEKGARGGSVSLPRRHSARALIAKAMPVARKTGFWLGSHHQARAILFVSDPDAPSGEAADEVLDAYGLTQSEKKLVRELMAGRSLQEAADTLQITRITSRNRLARIMSKTDTHRQSELLQLMLRSSIPAR